MTADDACWAEAAWPSIVSRLNEDRADDGHVLGDSQVLRGPDQLRRNARWRLADERTSEALIYVPQPPHPESAAEPPARARRGDSGGMDATRDQEGACSGTCSHHIEVDEYVAERDRARAELAKIRLLVERHITTHGIYADRRLKDWYDATATYGRARPWGPGGRGE
jgi:hypothetical protein